MREYSILFSRHMVRAMKNGTKTQTRRVAKFKLREQASLTASSLQSGLYFNGRPDAGFVLRSGSAGCWNDRTYPLICPYGIAGDRLWVRETYYAYGIWIKRYSEKKRRDEWHFADMTLECDRCYQYEADQPDMPPPPRRGAAQPGWHKRPAIFMPRAASRMVREITAVRVERLHRISDDDAIAEGIIPVSKIRPDNPHETQFWRDYRLSGDGTFCVRTPQESFASLWRSINGPDSWAINHWVWVVEFKQEAP